MKVYDGDKVLTVSKKEIVNLEPDKLVATFEATAVFYDLVTSLEELIKQGIVTSVCEEAVSPEFHKELRAGIRALTDRMDKVLGEDVTAVVWTKTVDAIAEVKA